VDDLKIQVHTYDAEMGRTGGGVFAPGDGEGDAANAAGIATELKRSVRSYAREREPAVVGATQ